MLKEYNEYLDKNKETIKFIKENNLLEDINKADLRAIELANLEGNQYLHSYRYSRIYDVIKEKKINIESIKIGEKSISITNLLENPYAKKLSELICDSLTQETNMEISY